MDRVLAAVVAGIADNSSDARRFFHGRGQCFPGLEFINVDWFAPVLSITLYTAPAPEQWAHFLNGIEVVRDAVACAVVQHRYLRTAHCDILWGKLPEQLYAREAGLRFAISLGAQQNSGFFLDMAPGREWLRARAQGCRVLNLFSYTCAFSVVAIAAGARTVVNVDMSVAALARGKANHRLNGQGLQLKGKVDFFAHDIFRSWGKISKRGPYDIVIIDPPSWQQGSFFATQDYVKVLRRLSELLPAGGEVLACLNAPELDEDFLRDMVRAECAAAVFAARLPNRVDFPERDARRSLKVLPFHLPAV